MRLWDVKAAQPRAALRGHTELVTAVAFSPDGRTLVSGSGALDVPGQPQPGEMRVWDVRTGRQEVTLTGHVAPVTSVAFSPDGLTLASGSEDASVTLWDVRTGQSKATFVVGDVLPVQAVAFSPDGLTLASGTTTGRCGCGMSGPARCGRPCAGHTDIVQAVAFSPDGLTLASGSTDGTVRLWDARHGQPGAVLSGATKQVWSVAFSPDGLTLASGSIVWVEEKKAWSGEVSLWDARTGQTRATLSGQANRVNVVAFGPDGRTLASGSGVWDLEKKGLAGEVRLWDAATGRPGPTLQDTAAGVTSGAFSPDGATFAGGSCDQTVRLWDVRTGRLRGRLEGPQGPVQSVAYSPDGRTVAGSTQAGDVWLWDTETGQAGLTLTGHEGTVFAVTFSRDGQTLVSASFDGTVRLWEVKTGRVLATLPGHPGIVFSCLAFSPNGQTLATGSGNQFKGEVWLWDVKTGQQRAILPGHKAYVQSVAFSPDGQTLASGSYDGTIRLWDLGTGQPLERDRADRLALEPVNRVWWHQKTAAQAEADQNWFAAAFHLDQLLKDKPDDAALLRRRDEVREKSNHLRRWNRCRDDVGLYQRMTAVPQARPAPKPLSTTRLSGLEPALARSPRPGPAGPSRPRCCRSGRGC